MGTQKDKNERIEAKSDHQRVKNGKDEKVKKKTVMIQTETSDSADETF